MPSKKHKCALGPEFEAMLPVESGLWSKLCNAVRKPCQISEYHPQTNDWFYSFPEVMAERQRHVYEEGCCNHPYSMFSLCWNSLMIFVNLAHMWLSPFRLCFIIVLELHCVDGLMLLLNFICFLDILIKLNTGYGESKRGYVAMYRGMVFRHYLCTWLLLDVVSILPVPLVLLVWYQQESRWLLFGHVVPMLRFPRIHTAYVHLKTLVKTFTTSYVCGRVVSHVMMILMTCHWCCCLLYLPPVVNLYWYGEIPQYYTVYINKYSSSLLDFSVSYRYWKGTIIAVASYIGTGYAVFRTRNQYEFLVHSAITMFTSIMMIYNFVFVLKLYTTLYSTSISYNELTNQVESYMRHKQFPLALKTQVREFYHSRYRGQYFHEEHILASLSESLRNEIKFHARLKLTSKVSLFEGVYPDLLGYILGSLKREVFMPNEPVLRAGQIGHCMYFVASGTVAVYSLKGVEICHLDDGAYFGEVALLVKDSKRVATVIAVETTLLYRLDEAEFHLEQRDALPPFTMLRAQLKLGNSLCPGSLSFERIQELGSKRMNETVIIDKEYRSRQSRSSSEP